MFATISTIANHIVDINTLFENVNKNQNKVLCSDEYEVFTGLQMRGGGMFLTISWHFACKIYLLSNPAIIDCERFVHTSPHVADNFIKSSEVDTKRALLKSIFRTLKLKGKTLCYDLNFPFNILEKYTENNNWRRWRDSNPWYPCEYTTFPM